MAFNAVLQSQIQPQQTIVQPDGASFAAGALGTLVSAGAAFVEGQQKKEAAQQKAFVTEKVSAAALPLADLFSNAGSGKDIRVAQQARDYENKLRQQGFSNAEIVEVYKMANSASGTSYSGAVKADRSAAAEQVKAQDQFYKDYMGVSAWIPPDYLTDDGKIPMEGPEAQAAFLAAKAAKSQNEAAIANANRVSAESNASLNSIQSGSRFISEGLSTQFTNLISQQVWQYDFNTQEGRQSALGEVVKLKAQFPIMINGVQGMTRSDKDSLISGMGTLLTALEDNITGDSMRQVSAKQTAVWLQNAKDIALSENQDLLQAYIYSGLGIQVQSTSVDILERGTLAKIAAANPNSKNIGNSLTNTNLTLQQRNDLARDAWAKLRTPIKQVDNQELANMYSQDWASVFAAPLPADQAELFGPDGLYLKSLDIFRDKKTADNYGVQVLGNEDFLREFTAANGKAISTYIPLVMNQIEGYEVKVKEQVKLSTKTGPVQFSLDIPKRISPNPLGVADTINEPSVSAINKVNTILKKQYEAAVQIDRVNGGNLAEQIRNAQLRTASLFIQVDAN